MEFTLDFLCRQRVPEISLLLVLILYSLLEKQNKSLLCNQAAPTNIPQRTYQKNKEMKKTTTFFMSF